MSFPSFPSFVSISPSASCLSVTTVSSAVAASRLIKLDTSIQQPKWIICMDRYARGSRETHSDVDAGPKLPLYPNGERQKQGKILNWGVKKRKTKWRGLIGRGQWLVFINIIL